MTFTRWRNLALAAAALALSCSRDGEPQQRHDELLERSVTPSAFVPYVSVYDDLVDAPLVHDRRRPSIVSDGAGFLAAWVEWWLDHPTQLRLARVTEDGEVLDPGGFALAWHGRDVAPALAFDGTNYRVAWSTVADDASGETRDEIRVARVTRSGTILDPDGILVASPSRDAAPGIACTPGGCLVVWKTHQTYVARVALDGTVLQPGGIPISPYGPYYWETASVATDGTGFLVAWQEANDIQCARVGADGTVLDCVPIVVAAAPIEERSPIVHYASGSYLVAWASYDQQRGEEAVRARRLASDGVLLDQNAIEVSGEYESQSYPTVTVSGTPDGYHVSWTVDRVGGPRVILERAIDSAGSPVGTPSVAVTNGKWVAEGAGSGARLVASVEDGVVFGRLRNWSDTSAPVPFPISGPQLPANAQRFPAVAALPSVNAVVWADDRGGLGRPRTYQRLGRDLGSERQQQLVRSRRSDWRSAASDDRDEPAAVRRADRVGGSFWWELGCPRIVASAWGSQRQSGRGPPLGRRGSRRPARAARGADRGGVSGRVGGSRLR